MDGVADPGRLHELPVPGLDEEAELGRRVLDAHGWQLPLPGGHPGDGERVPGIALAGATGRPTLPAGQHRRHLPGLQADLDQGARRGRAIGGAALETDDRHGLERADPGDQGGVTPGVVGQGPLVERRPEIVDEAAARLPLWVSMPMAAMERALPSRRYDGHGSGGQLCVGSGTTLL